MIDKIKNIIDKKFDNQLQDMQNVLRIPTIFNASQANEQHPFGENLTKCLDEFLKISDEHGFTSKNIDNMIGYADMGEGEKLVGVLGHLDVVPEGNLEKWIAPPFGAEIIDGKLYARGVLDDKGPMVACMYALSAMKEAGIKFNKRFRLILGLDEETSFKCVKRYLETEEVPYFSFSPDATFGVVHAEKGILQFSIKRTFKPQGLEPIKILGMTGGEKANVVPDIAKVYFSGNIAKIKVAIDDLNFDKITTNYVDDYLEVVAEGVAAHAKEPSLGENAILKLVHLLTKLEYAPSDLKLWLTNFHEALKYESNGKSLGVATSDEISGELTINPAVIWYKGEELIMKFDMRYPVSLSMDEGEEIAKKIAQRLGAMYRGDKHKAPLNMPKDMPEIKLLLDAYENVTGEKGDVFAIGGGTYCRAFPNAVSFGPAFPDEEETIHQVNENATIDNIRKFTHIYAEALYKLNQD